MRCHDVRRLFGALWDDETTQAERDWIEAHFASCESCRREYDVFARSLELVSGLPRVEPAPDLLDRTLARARRASTTPDHLPASPSWVPVTAAAAVLLVTAALVTQWIGIGSGPRGERMAGPVATSVTQAPESATAPAAEAPGVATVAAASDSLFDHEQDIEFVLDPVTLRRGRANVVRTLPAGVQTEQAVVSF
jgi:predicted anti-sigma-YlaC factor YlaD